MTINGPAPMLMAMFMNSAIDQRVEKIPAHRSSLGCGRKADRESCATHERWGRTEYAVSSLKVTMVLVSPYSGSPANSWSRRAC